MLIDSARSVVVRAMTAADVTACARWVDGHALFEPYGMTAVKLASSLHSALERSEGLLVAERTTKGNIDPGPVQKAQPSCLLGMAWFLNEGTFFHSGYLRLLMVSQEVTGGGVGRELMMAVEAAVFDGTRDLFLLVNTENHAAQRFYERLGYARVGELRDYVAPGLHEFIYRKQRPELD